MNIAAWFILSALVLEFLFNLIADILNLRALKNSPPDEFKPYYHATRYRRSQRYLRENMRLGWFAGGFNLLVVLAFWFGGGFSGLDAIVRGLGWGTVASGVLYIGTLVLFQSLVSLPFKLYATFVIEARYGFNRTSPATFVLDRLKGVALAIVLGGPLLLGILYLFEAAGANAWWYSWLVVVVFMLVMQYVAPNWIMPLFNRFEPLQEEALRNAILGYAASIQFPLKNVFIMDGSKRSSKSNAFFTGFGRNKRIVLFDTLIEDHSTAELVAVIGHEMGHYKKHHILTGMGINTLQMGLMFFLLSLCVSAPALFEAFGVPQISVYAGMVFFGLLYTPVDFFLSILGMMVSRRNEFSADRFAVDTTGNAEALISALKTLTVNHLSNLTPHPFYVFLNYSHPPVLARIRAIRAHAGGAT